MKYKHIEAMREARLWICQIIVPVGMIIMAIPKTREYVKLKAGNFAENIKSRLKRESY